MQIKIYVNNKPLFLVSEISKEVEEYLHHEETVFIDELNIHTVKTMIHEMEAPQIMAGVFLHPDVNEVLKIFKKKLSVVMAAGGVVYNLEKKLLLIYRHGKWDLPKGKLDPNEDLSMCAMRETKEETGLSQVEIIQTIFPTWHTYHQEGKHILKETHWYVMKTDCQVLLKPQVEEGIEKCEWVSIDELETYIGNTYAIVKEVINSSIVILKETKFF